MNRPRRLLTIGHSYVVALNRRLAHEMAKAAPDRWDVTAVAPEFMRGELRPIHFERIAGEAGRTVTAPLHLSQRPHVSFYSRRLRGLVRENWDLVHVWEEPYVAAGFQICNWVRKEVPVVFWTAQNLRKSYPPPFNWFERSCLEKCRGWLACGQTTAETLTTRGYSRKPHRIIPLGVDLDVFRPNPSQREVIRRQLGWTEPGPPVVGYLGRFVTEKGVETLIKALERLNTPWRALFVGGGPLESRLRDWSSAYGDGRAKIAVNVVHDQVPAYLNAMDVLAAPSQTTPRWREQLGRMLIEGMACGIPVVGSDSGEIPYVIQDAGRIVSESDVGAWTETLGQLIDSLDERRRLAIRGRERAHAEYRWSVIAERHLNFFDELLEADAASATHFSKDRR